MTVKPFSVSAESVRRVAEMRNFLFIVYFWRFLLFYVGLRLQGARCQDNKLELTATISTDLALTSLKWIRYGLINYFQS